MTHLLCNIRQVFSFLFFLMSLCLSFLICETGAMVGKTTLRCAVLYPLPDVEEGSVNEE